jgi:hypothetical protein
MAFRTLSSLPIVATWVDARRAVAAAGAVLAATGAAAFAQPTVVVNADASRGGLTDVVTGSGTVTLNNNVTLTLGNGSAAPGRDYLWDGGTGSTLAKTYWNVGGGMMVWSAYASLNNNEAPGATAAGKILNARPVYAYGAGGRIEFAAGFNADLGTGPADIRGGLSTLRVNDITLRTHASQNLPSVWKHTADHQPAGTYAVTHHGLLIFGQGDPGTPTPGNTARWEVRTADQRYDGGINWGTDWALDVAAGLKLVSDTAYEQNLGPHVSFGDVRNDNTGATVTKVGGGSLVIARGGVQGYAPGARLRVRQGDVEFNSNPTQLAPTFYTTSAAGQNLQVDVSDGAAVAFRAYTWPYATNWYNAADVRVNGRHAIRSLSAAGTVTLGGLSAVAPRGSTLTNTITPAETAAPDDAVLLVSGDATFASTAKLKLVFGADEVGSAVAKVQVGGTAQLAGTLEPGFAGSFSPARTDVLRVLSGAAVGGNFAADAWGLIPVVAGQGRAAMVPAYSSTGLTLSQFTRPGDVNLDGSVNNLDIAPFVAALTRTPGPTGPAGYAADADGDGRLTNLDIGPFVALLTRAGVSTDGLVIPEPAAAWLTGAGGLLCRRRRR